MGGGPDLVGDDDHHENQIEAERPDHGEFGAVEVAAGDVVFLAPTSWSGSRVERARDWSAAEG